MGAKALACVALLVEETKRCGEILAAASEASPPPNSPSARSSSIAASSSTSGRSMRMRCVASARAMAERSARFWSFADASDALRRTTSCSSSRERAAASGADAPSPAPPTAPPPLATDDGGSALAAPPPAPRDFRCSMSPINLQTREYVLHVEGGQEGERGNEEEVRKRRLYLAEEF